MTRVLLVADRSNAMDRLSQALEHQGITVFRAADGAEGLRRLGSEPIDCVISSGSLPDTGGVQFLKRARSTHPDTPTVLLIDELNGDVLNRAYASGITSVLDLDPTAIDQVVDCIRTITFDRQIETELDRDREFEIAIGDALKVALTASTREELEELVCEQLVRTGVFTVAWMSRYDSKTDEYIPQAAAGIDVASLRRLSANGNGDGSTVTEWLRLGNSADSLDETEVGNGNQPDRDESMVTAIAISLSDGDETHGALHLYSDRGSIPEVARSHIEDFGTALTRAIAAVSSQTTGTEERPETEREVTNDAKRPALETYGEVIAHELRNQVDVAQSYLRLGRERENDEQFDRVVAALHRIERLADEAVAVARRSIDSDDMTSRKIGNAATTVWDHLETGEAELTVTEDGLIHAHQDLLELLLENLFRNSIIHADGDIQVHVGVIDDGFFVEDDGPGIPPDRREQIFEWGYSTMERGDGIGLAIVKRIADAHEWDITVTEGTEGGTRFEFTGVSRSNWEPLSTGQK